MHRIAFIVLLLISQQLFSQQSAPPDSLLFHLGNDVYITATRLPSDRFHAPTGTNVIHREDILRAPALSLADLLTVSGDAGVRQYGGPGSLQLASMRGLGPEYTVVMLNGMRLNDAQSGSVDLSRLLLYTVESVDISHGGFASLYGSNAIGGVIDVRTGNRRPSLSIGEGAFGWKTISGSAGKSGERFAINFNALYEEAANDFSFNSQSIGSEIVRRNSNYIRRNVQADGSFAAGATALQLFADFSGSDAGVPGAYYPTSSTQAPARQQDNAFIGMLSSHTIFSPVVSLSFTGSVRKASEYYVDPSYMQNGLPYSAHYDNTAFAFSSAVNLDFSGLGKACTGIELRNDQLTSPDIPNAPHRYAGALYASAELPLGSAFFHAILYPSLRFDAQNDKPGNRSVSVLSPGLDVPTPGNRSASAFSPGVGVTVPLVEDRAVLFARASRGFRTPTFNEMYWAPGGNPDLKPEYSTAIDGGFRVKELPLRLSGELEVFHHDVRDLIVWMPYDRLYFLPQNVDHVVSQGVNVKINGSFFSDVLRFGATAQWLSSEKINETVPGDGTAGRQLVYNPAFSASLRITAAAADWCAFTVQERYTGSRFTAIENTSSLPAYFVCDATLVSRVSFAGIGWILKIEALNIFNRSYQVIEYYPVPGRNFRGTLSVTL